MRKKISTINIAHCVVFGYLFPMKNILFALQMIVSFLLVYMVCEFFVFSDNAMRMMSDSSASTAEWIKDILIYGVMGWVLFSISRRVHLGERLSKMKLTDVFSGECQMAMVTSIFAFVLCSLLMDFSNEELTQTMIQGGGVHKGNLIVVLLFAYVSSIAFMASFIAIAFASNAAPMSYMVYAFHPSFLMKVFVLWLLCSVPVQGAYFGVQLMAALSSGVNVQEISQIMARSGFAEQLLYGFVQIASFMFFASAMVKSTEKLLLFRHVLKARLEEIQNQQKNVANSGEELNNGDQKKGGS